jgi:outer membrane protein OmpA-like peptidoglycan-associated protein
MDEELLVSDADLYCSYIIVNKIPEDIKIIGAEEMDLGRDTYSDDDKMYINKGASAGINEGDVFLVLEKGKKISNRLTHKTLGIYYQQKSRAVVTCLYEDKAVITLKKGCHPVYIGDLLIPFKAVPTIFKLKLKYTDCKLPKTGTSLEGNVVFEGPVLGVEREMSGVTEYVTIDLGKAMVSRGTTVLLYKYVRKDLPPVIFGTGVVVHPLNTNSTVKILYSVYPVEVGHKLVVLPEPEEMEKIAAVEREEIPVIDAEKDAVTAKEALEVNLLFKINEKNVDARYADEFEKVKAFIASNPQYSIVLKGFACSVGSLEYNLRLSKERVDNVKAYLVKALGIDENLIESYFYGEKDAPFDNTSEEQRRKNRLVQILVSEK